MRRMRGTLLLAQGKAQEIIKRFDIQKPEDIDLDFLAWKLGAFIEEKPLDGFEGRSIVIGRRAIITVKSSIPEQGRKRFVVAHELGHLQLIANSRKLLLCTSEDFLNWYKESSIEHDANTFAAELLMPESIFAPYCADVPSFDLFSSLANIFRASFTATVIRYATFTPYRVAVVCSKAKIIKWAQMSNHFGYWIQTEEPLDPGTYAIESFAGQGVTNQFEIVEAKAWLRSRDLLPNSFIRELVIPMPTYNSALSIVWIDKTVEEDSYER